MRRTLAAALTLMILVAATWMGLYLAKRITRPIQTLAAVQVLRSKHGFIDVGAKPAG